MANKGFVAIYGNWQEKHKIKKHTLYIPKGNIKNQTK